MRLIYGEFRIQNSEVRRKQEDKEDREDKEGYSETLYPF